MYIVLHFSSFFFSSSLKAKEQKKLQTAYDKLPAHIRKAMTKKEYESIEFRDEEVCTHFENVLYPVYSMQYVTY
jgi:hypothetical protein